MRPAIVRHKRRHPQLRLFHWRSPAFHFLLVAALGLTAIQWLSPRGAARPVSASSDAAGSAWARPALASAFAAAFGPADFATRRIGPAGELTRFTPALLIEAPFGPVLISEGRVISPHPDSRGKLAIAYLRRQAGSYRVSRQFLPAAEGGDLGELGSWLIRANAGRYPVVELEDGGCTAILLELRPAGPVELVADGRVRTCYRP